MNTTCDRSVLAVLALMASGTAAADEWRWSVTPYVWATDVGLDLQLSDRQLVDATIPFEDLLEDLELITQVRVDGWQGAHGLHFDLFNVELADNNDSVTLPDPIGGQLVLDSELGMTIFDAAGVFDPGADRTGISFLYGTRIISQRENLDAERRDGDTTSGSASYDATDTFVDGLVGLRYAGRWSEHWGYELAADVSTGGTDVTWSIAPTVAYTFGARDQYTLSAGYRRMEIEFETEEPVDFDMSLSGALVGFRVAF